MHFELTDDQYALIDQVDRFLAGELTDARRRAQFDTAGYDGPLWQGLSDLGLTALVVPEQYGGMGLGLLDAAVVAESLGAAACPGPWLQHVMGTLAISLAGSDAQKTKWLPLLATGEVVATVAFGEAQERWDADQWTSTASDTVQKHFVGAAERAGLIVVGLADGVLGLVDVARHDIEIHPVDPVDRTRPFSSVSIPAGAIEPMPLAEGRKVVDAGLVLIAADAQGGARRMLEMIVDYAKLREQFGRPIGAFQAMKHQLADLAMLVEPGAPLYWYAAHAFDHLPDEAALSAAVAKAHLTDGFSTVARRATEMHGGVGYTWEHPAHIWLRRSLFNWAWLGAPAYHRARAAELQGW